MLSYQCFGILWFNTNGYILSNSQDLEAAVGDTITYVCKSNLTTSHPITWYHLPVSLDSSSSVLYKSGNYGGRCNDRRCTFRYDGRFEMRNLSLEDAGKFTCQDKDSKITVELVVFDAYPSHDSCGIKQSLDQSTLELIWHPTCSLRYRGNTHPQMEWTKNGKEGFMSSTDKTVNGITTSGINLTTEQFVAHSYVCRIRYPTTFDLLSNYSWSTIGLFEHSEGDVSTASPDDIHCQQPKVKGGSVAAIIFGSEGIFVFLFIIRKCCGKKEAKRCEKSCEGIGLNACCSGASL